MRHSLLAALVGLACAAGGPALARDVALVLGNDAYRQVPPLAKAVNDARSVAAVLARTGFVVTEAENLDGRAMSQAFAAFSGSLQPGDRALLYYSGHGFAIDGTNYLLPTDVPALAGTQQAPIRDASFPVDRIIGDLRQHGAQVAVLVLDACRNDPFASATTTRGLPVTRGLARIEAPDGVFVLMSASPHQEALDSLSPSDTDPNSVFTRTFLTELKPGRTMVEIAKRTQVAVKTLAATVGFEQMPAYSDQVIGDVVLSGTAGQAVQSGPANHVSPTQIKTTGQVQAGAGVTIGPGVVLGPGVVIGGKDAAVTLQTPGTPAGPQVAALMPDPIVKSADLGRAPLASFQRSNAGWSASLSLPEAAVAIGYRFGAAGEFRDTGTLDVLDPRTGQRMPNPSWSFSGRTPATVLEVRYERPDGTMAGPFPIRFDPDVALFDAQKKALQQIWPGWAEFREFNGLLVYFTTLVTYRCAIADVRYGLDGAAPLSRFDMPGCNPAEPFTIPPSAKLYLKLPTGTKSMNLQITWKDGTRSDVETIER